MQMTDSYLDKIAVELRRTADPNAAQADEDLSLYRIYAVLLLTKGQEVVAEDVHNAWAAWACEHEPESGNLMPFKDLSLRVQRKDQPYVDAIHQVAERMRLRK
jgi:hypothetical protein